TTGGLVGHWTFDAQDMTQTIADVTGNGNNGSTTNATTGTTTAVGRIGQALALGTTGQIDIKDANLNITTVMTLAFWIKGLANANTSVLLTKDRALTSGWIVQSDASLQPYIRVDTAG